MCRMHFPPRDRTRHILGKTEEFVAARPFSHYVPGKNKVPALVPLWRALGRMAASIGDAVIDHGRHNSSSAICRAQKLEAVRQSVAEIRPPPGQFYEVLNVEQKARFSDAI